MVRIPFQPRRSHEQPSRAREALRLKGADSVGMVLLVTKGPRPIQTHKRLKVARAVPGSDELRKCSLIVFVQPFDISEAKSLETWLDKTAVRAE